MKRNMRIKMPLIAILSVLIASLFLSNTAFGYGTSFGTATSISTGTYYEILSSADDSAYYYIYGSSGQVIRVTIMYGYPSWDLDLHLYDSTQYLLTSAHSTSSTDTVSYTVSSQTYYIVIERYSGTGDASFTMTISFNSAVPGFELLYLFFGVFLLLGIALILKRRQINRINIL